MQSQSRAPASVPAPATEASQSVDPMMSVDNSVAQDQLGADVGEGLTCEEDGSTASSEARARITDFLSQSYEQENWVTGNGYGAFDLCYEPTTGSCMVSVDLEFDFQNAPASVMMKYLGLVDLSSLAECVWSEDEKKKFQDDMIAQVHRVWSGKHAIKCTHDDPDLTDGMSPTWSDLQADVNCAVHPVASGGHFKVSVLALPKADDLRPFVSGKDHDTASGATPNRASPGRRTPTGYAVDDANFKQTGAQFNKHDNESEKKTSSFNGTTYTVVAGDTLSGIAQKLFGDGNRWQELYDANKAVVGPDPDKILPGQSLKLKVPKTEQVTTAHEFGHMLGLDDQYLGGGGGAGTPGAVNDDGSKTSAVPVDEHRIMDGGEVVETEHYSTIVEALNASTAPVTFGT